MRINPEWEDDSSTEYVKIKVDVGDTKALPEPLKTDHKKIATKLAIRGEEREVELVNLAAQMSESRSSLDFHKINMCEQLAFLQMQITEIQKQLLKENDKN